MENNNFVVLSDEEFLIEDEAEVIKREAAFADEFCGENAEVRNIFNQIMSEKSNIFYISSCNNLDIRGDKFLKLYNECCNGSISKFKTTVRMFNTGIFNSVVINDNLNLPKSLPFIDENIVIDGFDPSSEFPDQEAWREYCVANKNSYTDRYNELVGPQTVDELSGYYQDPEGNFWVSYEDYLQFSEYNALEGQKQK